MSYTQVFGGTTLYPSDVTYLALALDADKALEWPLESNDPTNPAARVIDVTTTGAYSLTLPDATQTGAGQTLFFNNLSASTNSFTLRDAAGGVVATIAVGEQWQAYLAGTATAAGTWRVFRFGASTATVQASALAGYGLTVTSNTLSQSMPVTTFNTGPRTVLATDRASALVWNGTGTGTLNLLSAATAGNNFFIAVRNSGGGDLTVDAAGSETIDGLPALALRPGESTNIITDGLAWYTLGLGQEAVFAFDYTAITVTGGTYTLAGSELNRIAYKFVGTLTADQYIVVPSTVQQYWVDNATTGPFNFYLQTSGGTPASVTQGARGIYYCNGSQVVDADTATVSLPISAADGGTGITSYTVGDLIYANSTTTLAKLADVAVGNVLLSGGVGTAPLWGKVNLATAVTGVLPSVNGGMAYPGAGVAVSTGSAWGTSLTAPSGALVGTTDSQTLTNKTIALANNTVNYTPAGTGAVTRTVQAKLNDTISVSDYASLTDAITSAKVSGRPTVILVNGDITVSATIVVDASNITLQGAGGDSSHDVGTQGAGARAKLIWAGAAGGTVLRFASPVGAGNQTQGGGGANNLYIACGASAAIGLQVQSWRKGTFENIHIDNPTTVGLDIGVVATLGEARDTQNCYFRNISSRHFEVAGGTGGLLRLGGDASANVSLNMFEQLDCAYLNGTAYLFNNCDNNYFIRTRAFRGGGGTGSAVVFNGSNVSAAECARSNIFTHFTSNGPLPIICRGTSSFTHPSVDNSILLLDFDNGYTPPTVEPGSSATWSDTRGLQARFGYITLPAGDDISNTAAAETRIGSATAYFVNGSQNHMRLSDASGANEWGISLDASGNLRAARSAGSGLFTIGQNTTLDANVSVVDTGVIAATSPGFRGLPLQSKTASYTLALADAGKLISITTGGVVIPANGSVAFPVGTAIVIYNDSGSTQTISITTDTLRQAGSTNTGSRTLAVYGVATVTKVSATVWVISGNVS